MADWTPGTPVHLTTDRFIIRSTTPKDITPKFLKWQNDRELRIGQNQRGPKMDRVKMLNVLSKNDNARRFLLLITTRLGNAPIGFFAANVAPTDKVAETTVVIGDRNWWGKGVVTEARARLVDFLFDEVGLNKVMGRPHARNLPSIFNYRAQGFKCEGILRQQMTSIVDGESIDQMVFSMLRDEWKALKEKGKT